jgi:DNA-binding winged helix-turn-helix (wHTH) protein
VSATETAALLFRFGAFELDLKNNELRRNGVLIKLPPQPMQVLRLLAENAGEIQSRDKIQQTIWGAGTFVDFDRNLNVCMAQIRAALSDDADSPRFIQTIPRRGYRFVAPVERVAATRTLSRQPRNYRAPAILVAVVGLAALTWAVLSIRHSRTASPDRLTIAVLPFDTPERAQERLSDGLVEELIGNLGSLHPERLGVIARSSVMRYAGARRPIDGA